MANGNDPPSVDSIFLLRGVAIAQPVAGRSYLFNVVDETTTDFTVTGRTNSNAVRLSMLLDEEETPFPGPPAEHFVDDGLVAEQVCDDAVVGFAFYVVEQDWAAAIEFFLKRDDLEIRVDFLVGDHQIALILEPFQRAAQIIQFFRGGAGGGVFSCRAHKIAFCK